MVLLVIIIMMIKYSIVYLDLCVFHVPCTSA